MAAFELETEEQSVGEAVLAGTGTGGGAEAPQEAGRHHGVLPVAEPGLYGLGSLAGLAGSRCMISAESPGNDIEAAFEARCDDFLAKPFRSSELVARVDDLRA